MKTMNQRVGNLPASFQAVHNNIQKCTSQQDMFFRAFRQLGEEHKDTNKHVGQVHDLVSHLWDNNRQTGRLAEANKTLETALQEMNRERRASQSLLADSETRMNELLQQRAKDLELIKQLEAELKAYRVEASMRWCAENIAKQAARETLQTGCAYDAGTGYSIKKKY